MKSICFFAAYFTSAQVPYYVEVYLQELKKHFDEVVLLCSQNNLSADSRNFLEVNQIQLSIEKNEGFDFGLWYKAFTKFDVDAFDRVALVNDSCILFKPLDAFMAWASANPANIKGITRSDAVYPHLQSYFLLMDRKAIALAKTYFDKHRVLTRISEVIETYEIGLSKYWQENQLQIAAFIDNNGYKGEFSPYYHCIHYHLKNGIPLIKKKIIYRSYRKPELFTLARMDFKINPGYYLRLISEYNTHLIIDPTKLKIQPGGMSLLAIARYQATRILIKLYRSIFKK